MAAISPRWMNSMVAPATAPMKAAFKVRPGGPAACTRSRTLRAAMAVLCT